MAKYRHIVFDVDGTLIDTRDCILYSLQEMLMTVKGERYEIEDLKFVLANKSRAQSKCGWQMKRRTSI